MEFGLIERGSWACNNYESFGFVLALGVLRKDIAENLDISLPLSLCKSGELYSRRRLLFKATTDLVALTSRAIPPRILVLKSARVLAYMFEVMPKEDQMKYSKTSGSASRFLIYMCYFGGSCKAKKPHVMK